MSPTTRYAKSGDVHIAFQVFGEGPVELVVTPGFISNIEYYWDEPRSARWLTAMARFARVTIFDKRGTGLSDRVAVLPTMEERIGDMRAVMDAAGIDLGAVRAPTLVIHKTDDAMVPVAGGRELASLIPNAKLFEMPGRDHLPWFDDCSVYLAEMRAFLTGDTGEDVDDRALAVLLFSDIVDSTRRAESLGDRAWRDLLDRHDHALRRQLERFQGREVKTLGDGFLATFDGPSRAIRAAQAMREAANQLGIDIRAGLHAGEVEVSERDVRGIAVHITARISALAATNQIVVSRTVKDLVAGSEMAFNDLGTHALKGIPDEWQMFEVR